MSSSKLMLGGIYLTEWDNRPFRVIGLDNIEVFYDCQWPHDNSWTFSGNFKKKCYFYRSSSKLFEEKSKLIEHKPLTPEEQNAFRPDLLLRIGRTNLFNWNGFGNMGYQDFCKEIEQKTDDTFLKEKLSIDKVVLIPYGNNGGLKKGTLITAQNSKYFDCLELIWKAKELQEAINNQVSKGIGLYRIGFEKGVPSYYIGSYFDSAGLLKE